VVAAGDVLGDGIGVGFTDDMGRVAPHQLAGAIAHGEDFVLGEHPAVAEPGEDVGRDVEDHQAPLPAGKGGDPGHVQHGALGVAMNQVTDAPLPAVRQQGQIGQLVCGQVDTQHHLAGVVEQGCPVQTLDPHGKAKLGRIAGKVAAGECRGTRGQRDAGADGGEVPVHVQRRLAGGVQPVLLHVLPGGLEGMRVENGEIQQQRQRDRGGEQHHEQADGEGGACTRRRRCAGTPHRFFPSPASLAPKRRRPLKLARKRASEESWPHKRCLIPQ